jgi:hypothetical protein
MATALDLITSASRLINVAASGEQLSDSEATDGLTVLNDMIDSWNSDSLLIYTTRTDDFPFVLNKQAYTLGAGGDFNIPRPPRLTGVSCMQIDNPTNPIEIPMSMYTVDQWQNQIPVKQTYGSIPLICYDDGSFPLRLLSFWPIPNNQPNLCRIYSWQPLPAQSLAAQVSFPPGYQQAFRYNLAVLLAAEFAATVSQVVATIAVESLARVRTINAPDLLLYSDLAPNPSGYNWSADLFGNPYS